MTVDYTNRQQKTDTGAKAATQIDQGLRSHMISVYNHMGIGLAITGIVAFLVSQSPMLLGILFGNQIIAMAVMFAPLIFVFILGAKVNSLSLGATHGMFYAFATIMGVSLSTIFLAYTGASIFKMFFITSAAFGGLSLVGYTTKKDLSAMGRFMIMGLIGIIIASVVNIFLKSPGMEFVVSVLGVLIFAGLTAYDTQKVKNIYFQTQGEVRKKAAIMGALSLYLDFINLMLFLLRLFGSRR